MNIAIIPARGGSKRIPRKNVKELGGTPIISIVIKTLLSSRCFDQVVVSSDDPEIQAISRQAGAETPFDRPKALSDDHTPTLPVIKHALDWFEENGKRADLAACVYPTAALLNSEDMRLAFESVDQLEDSFLVAVTHYPHPVQRALLVGPTGVLTASDSRGIRQRTQDLVDHYHDAGQFYFAHATTWQNADDILTNARNKPYVLRRSQAVDIDTPDDWAMAEFIFHHRATGGFPKTLPKQPTSHTCESADLRAGVA